MEETGETPFSGVRQQLIKKTFNWAIRSIQNPWSKEEFSKAFPSFSITEQEVLFRWFLQVMTYLHKFIEEDFESLCLETEIGSILDKVERLVEEQSMDPLFSNKTNIWEIEADLLAAKKIEIQYLKDMLEKAEERKRQISARIELLKKDRK